ncbi:sel1 repeat family protein [Xenorhabdus bovienii]|uniref:sel1 repeat family protein n=1 Tax=Xenorhabdus bovienii TaxID=40576 RepID=UPI0023B2338F|nr:sel1 repeat family protein [Xenorhabdus bovienii]MDE9555771.1 sel1 repeat family protein [Xenorhabdus bovienii]
MTKKIKIWLILCAVFAITISVYPVYSPNSAYSPLQVGYTLYQKGDYQGALDSFAQHADNDPQAAFSLAMMYWNGSGIPEDRFLAQKWLIKSASQNNRNALYNLGYFRYHELINDTPEDIRGITSLTKAADLDLAEAQVVLSELYLHGVKGNIQEDVDIARKYASFAVENDSIHGTIILGFIAYEFDQDYKRAVEILTPVLKSGSSHPADILAHIYKRGGHGIEKNTDLAKKYSALVTEYDQKFGSVALSIYGQQTASEKKNVLQSVEKLAKAGDHYATYELFYRYLTGNGVNKDPNQAEVYLQPLVASKDPKALYLQYTHFKSSPSILFEAVNANYPDAVYLLYRIYNDDEYGEGLILDSLQAKKYLKLAADLGHHDALITLIKQSIEHYDFPNKNLNTMTAKYVPLLLEKYPESPNALMVASDLYNNKKSELYDSVRAFQLNKKAYEISPSAEIKLSLANKYAHAMGTPQDLEKAVKLLQENLANNSSSEEDRYVLAKLYFEYDISAYVEQDLIINILKNNIDEKRSYNLAHYYADYLLDQDPIKNAEEAFSLYKAADSYFNSAKIHHALSIIKYKKELKDEAVSITLEGLKEDQVRYHLTEKERQDGYNLLFKYGFNHPKANPFIIQLSINNHEARSLIQPLLNKDPEVTYWYAIANIEQMSINNNVDDNALKIYYNDVIKAAELGSINAIQFIIDGKIKGNSIPGALYYDNKFDQLTGTTQDNHLAWRNKCADLGNNQCLNDLAIIYQTGRYGVEKNHKTALTYYKRIRIDPDNDEYLNYKSDMKRLEKEQQTLDTLIKQYKNNDAKAAFDLAKIYKLGHYGQKQDDEKWIKYLEIGARLGSAEALYDLWSYYEQENLLEENRDKILGYYNQQINAGNQSAAMDLGLSYLYGLHLVEADRIKARQLLLKAGKKGERYLTKMDSVEAKFRLMDKDAETNFQLGYAHTYGEGASIDHLKAREYFKAAGEQGHPYAAHFYIRSLQDGVYNHKKNAWFVEPNWKEAVLWQKKYPQECCTKKEMAFYKSTVLSALNGNTEATLIFAEWYAQRQKDNAAAYWYQKVLDKGDLTAIPRIGAMITDHDKSRELYSFGTLKGDLYSKVKLASSSIYNKKIASDSELYQSLLQYLHEGLRSEDPTVSNLAFNKLVKLYRDGIRGYNDQVIRPKNTAEYLKLLEQESNSRNEALTLLVQHYYDIDSNEALEYFQQAYDKGNLKAANYLYKYYNNGYCFNRKDTNKAAEYLKGWLDRSDFSEEKDDILAGDQIKRTKKMGDAYFEGICDVEQNFDKAIMWYKLSLNYDREYALESLYNAYIAKGDAKEAYYYALVLDEEIENVALFSMLSDTEREAIKARYLKRLDKKP